MDFEQHLWKSVEHFVLYVTVLVKYRCHFFLSLFQDMLNPDKI